MKPAVIMKYICGKAHEKVHSSQKRIVIHFGKNPRAVYQNIIVENN